jgi:hypothetical protein
MEKHSWFETLIMAVQAASQERKASLLEWVERYGASVVNVLNNQLADRYRRRIAKKRDLERQQRLERAVQQGCATRSRRHSPRAERGIAPVIILTFVYRPTRKMSKSELA